MSSFPQRTPVIDVDVRFYVDVLRNAHKLLCYVLFSCRCSSNSNERLRRRLLFPSTFLFMPKFITNIHERLRRRLFFRRHSCFVPKHPRALATTFVSARMRIVFLSDYYTMLRDPKFQAVERVLRGAVSKVLHEYTGDSTPDSSGAGPSYSCRPWPSHTSSSGVGYRRTYRAQRSSSPEVDYNPNPKRPKRE